MAKMPKIVLNENDEFCTQLERLGIMVEYTNMKPKALAELMEPSEDTIKEMIKLKKVLDEIWKEIGIS